MSQAEKTKDSAAATVPVEEMSEAEIDRNLMDSFPASDPPSWTLGIDQPVESNDPQDADE